MQVQYFLKTIAMTISCFLFIAFTVLRKIFSQIIQLGIEHALKPKKGEIENYPRELIKPLNYSFNKLIKNNR